MVPFAAPVAATTVDWVAALGLAPRRVLDIAAGHGLFGLEFARRLLTIEEMAALGWAPVLAVAWKNAAATGLAACFRWG